MTRTTRPTAIAGIGVLAALTACSSGATHHAGHVPPARNVVHLSVHGSQFSGIGTGVRPGTVTLDFDNTGDRTHMAAIGDLSGHRVADVTAYLSQQHQLPAWLKLVGGVDELAAGHRGSWTGTLGAGSYAVMSLSTDQAGRPDAMSGMISALAVSGAALTDAAPPAPATITLGPPSALTMSSLPRGATAIKIVNDDNVPRTVDVTQIRPGKTFTDVMTEAQQGNGVPAALLPLGGTAVAPHSSVVIGIEAAPAGGQYVVFDIDHVQQGAITHVTVA